MLDVLVRPQVVQKLIEQNTIAEGDGGGDDEGGTDQKTPGIGEQESFFHEPSNFKIATQFVQSDSTQPRRRVTMAEDLPTLQTDVEYPEGYDQNRPRCRSRYSTFIAGLHQFDPYQELTATQIAAFRQVFDMVDRDGGGSIDAEELYLSMKDLESGLKLDEIKEILEELDRDGNGEIDFEEFLYMMTSMSLQIKEAQDNDNVLVKQGKRRQSIFFSVITKFAMKHSLKEIERYYASKAKRSPHVVGHYAAGARVFGLTDKELRKTWKEFSHASKGKDSPYAQPLNFVVDDHKERTMRKTIRAIRRKQKTAADDDPMDMDALAEAEANAKKFVFKLKAKATSAQSGSGSGSRSGSRRSSSAQSEEALNVSGGGGSRRKSSDKGTKSTDDLRQQTIYENDSNRGDSHPLDQGSPGRRLHSPGGGGRRTPSSPEKRDGWTPRHRLPITNVKLPKYTRPKERKLFTIRDMDEIRCRVNDVRDTYYDHLSKEKITKAKEYWRSLKTEQIQSDRLQTNFKKVFRCYSPTNDKEYRSQSPRRKNKSPDHDLDIYKSNGNFVF